MEYGDRPYLVGADGIYFAEAPSNRQGVFQRRAVDDVESEKLFFRLGERPVQDHGRVGVFAKGGRCRRGKETCDGTEPTLAVMVYVHRLLADF